jgi:hypothetical protein
MRKDAMLQNVSGWSLNEVTLLRGSVYWGQRT